MCNKTFVLLHDTPEIRMGAELVLNNRTNRYDVTNLREVARYPLTGLSHFSFHKDVVENKSYWFELLDEEDDNICDCDCHD